MNNILKVLPIIFVLLFSLEMQSQSTNYIYGKIVDSKNAEEVAFASVLVKNSRRGVVADEEGVFSIPTNVYNEYKVLVISCIGYQTKEVNLNSLKKDEVNIINLKVAVSTLDAVVVRAKKKKLSAKQIVKKAIQEIPNNYPKESFSYVGYYRDYQKDSINHINLNEAIVEIHDDGFQTKDREISKVGLLQYKTNTNFKREPKLLVNYDNTNKKFIPRASINPSGGNELSILMAHDAIRNYEVPSYSFIYIMKKHFVRHHNFKLTEITQKDGENLYVIDFKLKPAVNYDYIVSGQLFINRNTYAIHKLDYSLFRKEKKENVFNVQVEYTEQLGRMYLNYISFNNTFSAPNPKDFFLVEAAYNPYKEYLHLTFNNPYAIDNIYKSSNYKVVIDHVKIGVKKVILDTLHDRKVKLLLDFKNREPPILTDDIANKLKLDISNIKDTQGNDIGQLTYLTYKQYRELFVQELLTNKDGNTVFIDKFKPLEEGKITKPLGNRNYWMNTPLRKGD